MTDDLARYAAGIQHFNLHFVCLCRGNFHCTFGVCMFFLRQWLSSEFMNFNGQPDHWRHNRVLCLNTVWTDKKTAPVLCCNVLPMPQEKTTRLPAAQNWVILDSACATMALAIAQFRVGEVNS